jgi:hypothetical protein
LRAMAWVLKLSRLPELRHYTNLLSQETPDAIYTPAYFDKSLMVK